MAHFTAAVYTGLHAAEERLQSQIHTLEGGHGQTALERQDDPVWAWRSSVSSRHWLGKVIDRRAMRRAVPGRRRCKAGNDLQAGGGRRGELDAKLVRARSVILLHAALTYPRKLLLKSPGLHPWRRYHRR